MSSKNKVIDKYELLDKIGEGAFGIVYKARNILFDKIVALKIIKGASELQLNQYLREIRQMDKLDPPHLNVIRILSADIKNNSLLIEMEYFEGKTLLKLLDEYQVLDDEIVMEYLMQILDALSFIHSKRLVHRDIKPDNILLNKDYSLVKVSDFGISKDQDYSSSNTIQGTYLYMSPEQLTGSVNVDHRSDFYSLAVVIYQLKTGEIPFNGSITNILDGKRFKSIPKTKSFFDPIIQKASKKNPNERFSSAEEFKRDLIRAYEKSKKKRKSYIYWILILVFLILVFYRQSEIQNNLSLEEKSIPDINYKKTNIDSQKSDDKIKTVRFDNQIWMVDNLKSKVFQNNNQILEAHNKIEWDNACKNKIPAYCHVDDNAANDEKYGLLYNWYAAKDESICPKGFRIPNKDDFDKLMSNYSYLSLVKTMNLSFAGWRGSDGYYNDFNSVSVLWSSIEKYPGCIFTLKFFKANGNGVLKIGEQAPSDGYSIKCLKK
jgi:uncharacterized protein (TIGR02145 family)